MHEKQSSYSYDDLIKCGNAELFGPGNAQLPAPPMLMFDRITHISEEGGEFGKGVMIAEFDVKPDLWFFDCHFKGDPVMPGCLGLDALWQMTGFYLGWLGGKGRGRAIGVGEVKFTDQVKPTAKLITYEVHIRRVVMRQLVLGIANGVMAVDGETAYTTKDMKVGLFQDEDA